MKRVVGICVLLGSLAFGQPVQESQDFGRFHTMSGLETAMVDIEKGFLRNDLKSVKLGTFNLKMYLKNINSFVIEPSVMRENFNAQTYAATESTAIGKLADEILAHFEAGKNDDARNTYNKAMSRCLACHRILRQW